MMAALAGVVKEDDKDIARKMFRAGDINKQVDEVSKRRLYIHLGRVVTSRKIGWEYGIRFRKPFDSPNLRLSLPYF